MKSRMQTMALAGLLALAAGSASAAVTVVWDHPDNYYDLPFSRSDRDELLDQVTDHFKELGKYLPQGQDLNIVVTDFDPAGRLIPNFRLGRDLRILNGRADWPRMELHYSIEQNGQVLKAGDAKLSDMNYQQNFNRYFNDEPLRYEKQMIDDWFAKTIAPMDTRRR